MNSILSVWILPVLCVLCGVSSASARSLLLISVDGLRPDYVTKADEHKLKIPNLRRFLKEGSYATGVRGVLPTSTYPSHTTIITGVSPAKHGIVGNHPFDPTLSNPHAWCWYSEDIRVPTLWEAAAKGGIVVGSISWPVTVGAKGIHFNIPEFNGTRSAEDLKMVRALASSSLMDELEQKAGPYETDVNNAIPRDWVRSRYAVELIRQKKNRFLTVHLAASDHMQHSRGPFSISALEAIEEIDKMVGLMTDAIRSEDAKAIVCIVSDHGFARVDRVLKLDAAFVKAGLMTLKTEADSTAKSGIEDWRAMPWSAAGSASIVLKKRDDQATRMQVKELLEHLAAQSTNGIAAILDREAIAKLGGDPKAEFWVDLRPGFSISSSPREPIVSVVGVRGTHGFSPTHPEMNASFFIAGNGIRQGLDLGLIDMRNVAPTLAQAIGVAFPSAELPSLAIFDSQKQ